MLLQTQHRCATPWSAHDPTRSIHNAMSLLLAAGLQGTHARKGTVLPGVLIAAAASHRTRSEICTSRPPRTESSIDPVGDLLRCGPAHRRVRRRDGQSIGIKTVMASRHKDLRSRRGTLLLEPISSRKVFELLRITLARACRAFADGTGPNSQLQFSDILELHGTKDQPRL